MLEGPRGPYCPMGGHAERGCPGYPTTTHADLVRAGVGVSTLRAPSDSEIRDETRADRELVRGDMNGRSE